MRDAMGQIITWATSLFLQKPIDKEDSCVQMQKTVVCKKQLHLALCA